MSCENAEQQQILDALLGYLRTHIHAADTLEGIRDWWLPSSGLLAINPEALEGALTTLVQQRQLIRLESSNGRVLYINQLGRRMH